MIQIEPIYTESPLRNYSYLVSSGDGLFLAAVDPWDGADLAERIERSGRRLSHIINTHEHHDHTAGNETLLQRWRVPVLAMPGAAAHTPGFSMALQDGQLLHRCGGFALQAIWTPGHTANHLCLFLLQSGAPRAVITGDTLFHAGVGNCKNGGNVSALWNTIRDRFYTLPDETEIYPGHDYLANNLHFTLSIEPENGRAQELLAESAATGPMRPPLNIGAERTINLFFRLGEEAVLGELRRRRLIPDGPITPGEVFAALRGQRDLW